MVGAPSGSIRPVTRYTRFAFVAFALLAAVAGVQLYLLTDRTDHFFAWTIAQPLSATFLGTGYWTGTTLLLFAQRESAWANIRVPLAAVLTFFPLMALTTVLHLDRFHLITDDLNAWIAAWAWLIVYAVVPFAAAGILVSELRQPGGDPPLTRPMPPGFRALIAINAALSAALGVALFVVPAFMNSIWPWPLTPLTSRAIATGFFAVAGASLWFLRENSIDRARGGTLAYLLIGTLQLVAIARYADTIDWGRIGAWLYVLFMVAFLVGGLYSAAKAWLPAIRGRLRPQRATA